MLTSCDRVNVFDERCRDHTTYETLFRRSASQDRQSRPRRRYLQVRNRSPVRCEPLSSVKRYVRISDWGASLTPRKGGGRPPKVDQSTSRLLVADVQKRPTATVSERRRFLEHATGKALSGSTVGRLLKRLGFSRKNGLWGRWSETSF